MNHPVDINKRSLLFVIDQLTELGGAERMMFCLARSLQDHGYRVTVVTLRDKPSAESYSLIQEIIVLPIESCVSIKGLRTLWLLRNLIKEREVSLVQTYFESADLFGAIASRLAGVRAICSSRRDMGILRSRKHYALYRRLTPLFSHVFAVSQKVALWHQQADGIHFSNLSVVYNGVDVERYHRSEPRAPLRIRLGVDRDAVLITTVANINPWKGIDNFIEAAALVLKRSSNAAFAIAGDWTDQAHLQELRKRTQELGISQRVHFLGRVEDVPSLLMASDIFALLSRSEGFPNAVIEAMAAGLPVIATRVGGTPEAIVDRVTGYLVENEDYQAAAGRVLALLADEQERLRMGMAAKAVVAQRFSLNTMVKKHMEVYDVLLAN